jgi:hypothetical protein
MLFNHELGVTDCRWVAEWGDPARGEPLLPIANVLWIQWI